MPCFNDGKYIRDAVSSVRNQTYGNIELIIIDDGSKDRDTLSVLEEFRKEGITVLTQSNGGPASARNNGIAFAKGKYVLPLDADDVIEPTYVEKAVNAIQSRDNCGIVYCEADLFGEMSGKWNLEPFSVERILIKNMIFVSALFYKSDWEAVGGFHEGFKGGVEDHDFWLSIIGLGRQVYQIPETLFHYRIKGKSRNNSYGNNENLIRESYRLMYDRHPNLFKANLDNYIYSLQSELAKEQARNAKLRASISKIDFIINNPVTLSIRKKLRKKSC